MLALGVASWAVVAGTASVAPSLAADTPLESCTFAATAFPATLPANCRQPGDTVGVSLTGQNKADFGVAVPAPGRAAFAIVDRALGSGYKLDVSTSPEGDANAVLRSVNGSPSGSLSSPSKCNDYYYEFMSWGNPPKPYRRAATLGWYSNLATSPGNQAGTLADLKHAAAAMSNSSSQCDPRDLNPITQSYLGDRNLYGGVNTDGSCDDEPATDHISNVVFGALPATFVALTCGYAVGESPDYWTLRQSDVRLNSSSYTWKLSGQTCATSYSVLGVATHEFGHAYGLDDVPESSHGNLTMSASAAPCDFDQVNLGYGDLSGLGHLYGTVS